MTLQIIAGPPITGPNGMTKAAAEDALKRSAQFPKGADYQITALDGRWVAAFTDKTAEAWKTSEFPPSGGDEESGPPSDGGDEGPPSDDSGSDGPPSDGGGDEGGDKPKKEHGEKGGEHKVEEMLQVIMQALGIDPSMMGGDSMVPGMDGGMGGPPPGPGGPPGMGGPAAPHPGAGGPPGVQDKFPKPMKPGDTPPGGTPLGAPAFASVKETHPWGHMIGTVSHFPVREAIGNDDIRQVNRELVSLANSGGFRVASFKPFHDEQGNRYVEAVIETPSV